MTRPILQNNPLTPLLHATRILHITTPSLHTATHLTYRNKSTLFLLVFRTEEAQRRVNDARLLRKSIESDLNRLEMQLLQVLH